MHCLYQITNLLNGKYYIGVHHDSANSSYLGSGRGIKAAVKKYGKENFQKTIIAKCELATSAYLLESLMVNQAFVDSRDNYNQCLGGIPSGNRNHKGITRSAETRAKLSLANKGKPKPARTAEHRQNLSRALTGKHLSSETRQKLRNINTGKHCSPETCRKLSITSRRARAARFWSTKPLNRPTR